MAKKPELAATTDIPAPPLVKGDVKRDLLEAEKLVREQLHPEEWIPQGVGRLPSIEEQKAEFTREAAKLTLHALVNRTTSLPTPKNVAEQAIDYAEALAEALERRVPR